MLAALVGVNKTLKNPQEVIRNNTLLTINTLAWIKNNPVRRLLFSSSSEKSLGLIILQSVFSCRTPNC